MTKRDYLSAVLSVIHGEPRSDIEVRLIVSIDRRNTLEEAYEAVALAEEVSDSRTHNILCTIDSNILSTSFVPKVSWALTCVEM